MGTTNRSSIVSVVLEIKPIAFQNRKAINFSTQHANIKDAIGNEDAQGHGTLDTINKRWVFLSSEDSSAFDNLT